MSYTTITVAGYSVIIDILNKLENIKNEIKICLLVFILCPNGKDFFFTIRFRCNILFFIYFTSFLKTVCLYLQ